MTYGFIAPRKLPEQNLQRLMLLLDRWQRSYGAMQKWATLAKEATDFVEGRQWDEKLKAKMAAQGRPTLTINKTNRLVRLMLGYFANNRTDLKYLPGNDGESAEHAADALTALYKQISNVNEMPFVDAEVFADGLVTGRGYFDHRMCFENNDFGEVAARCVDPFSLYVDPDTQSYDLNKDCGFLIEARMGSLDEIECLYGKEARDGVEPFAYNRTPLSFYSPAMSMGETTPVRRFGMSEDSQSEWWDNIYGMLGAFVDPLRKSLRIMDCQYKVLTPTRMFVDLETGDRAEIPEDWDKNRIGKVLYWAQQNKHPMSVDVRPIRKVRWTTIVGDLMVYDDWSPYRTYTITGFYPYFRRGMTRGMVEDLMDPNREINKRRSARVDTIMRIAHSGWTYHEGSLDPVQEAKLRRAGAEPGFLLKWRGQAHMEPKKIEASAPPSGLQELERAAGDDMHEVSGINESALGELDIAQSGKALEARQRQTVISVQSYLTNFTRTKKLNGYKTLELFQEHYTEQRAFRILGENGKPKQVIINQQAIGKILNDITIGRYETSVDERPLAATFAAAQFDELMNMLEKLGSVGQMLTQMRPDLLVQMSSLPNKEEWVEALQKAAEAVSGTKGPEMPEAQKRLMGAQAFSAFGSGALNLAKARIAIEEGERQLIAFEQMLDGSNQATAASPPDAGGAPQPTGTQALAGPSDAAAAAPSPGL